MDIDTLWDYSNPEQSETNFREALKNSSKDEQLELRTQIARTHSLRRNFEEAHQILKELESELSNAGAKPKIRFHLEKGRAFNSANKKEEAQTQFKAALKEAKQANETGLAVDALHMIAITYAGQEEGLIWNQKALELARNSQDKKARALIPAVLNNYAWDLFDLKRYSEALKVFKEAQQAWESTGKAKQSKIAKWCVAKCLRLLQQHDDALSILTELENNYEALNESNGFVYEEIAENTLAQGKKDKAKPYFSKAHSILKNDPWLSKNETKRLERLKALS